MYSSSIVDLDPYAHAVLVRDTLANTAVARSSSVKHGSSMGSSTLKNMATSTYEALSLIDTSAPTEGYQLVLGGNNMTIGCVSVDIKLADGTKGGHRTCLAMAAKNLKSAIDLCPDLPLLGEGLAETGRWDDCAPKAVIVRKLQKTDSVK